MKIGYTVYILTEKGKRERRKKERDEKESINMT
jgi:hypothetical protein